MPRRGRSPNLLEGGLRGLVIEALVVVLLALFALGVALLVGWAS